MKHWITDHLGFRKLLSVRRNFSNPIHTMSKMEFDQKAIAVIKELEPSVDITEAVNNNELDGSFKDEANFESFTEKNIKSIQFTVSQDKRDMLVTKLQQRLGNGFVVYFSEQNFGHEPDEITVLESLDRYDALRFEGCNGVNYDVYTEDIITYLQELEQTNPFVLTGVGFDFVQGNFISPPSNVEELANSMYEFCPDIVEQGTETVEGLFEELKNSNTFYFWWD
jgi:hypothetical protein